MMTPRMEQLIERTGSRFALVTLSAMRAGEISDYYNQLGEGLGRLVPPQVTTVSHKPLSIAMEEIEIGKIEAVPLPPEVEIEDGSAPCDGSMAAPIGGRTQPARREPRESLWRVRTAPIRARKKQT
jgi:DNA-directed RNA polymerase subunit omega